MVPSTAPLGLYHLMITRARRLYADVEPSACPSWTSLIGVKAACLLSHAVARCTGDELTFVQAPSGWSFRWSSNFQLTLPWSPGAWVRVIGEDDRGAHLDPAHEHVVGRHNGAVC